MKLTLNFKTPDVIENAIRDANLSSEEAEDIRRLAQKYISFGECIKIEIDFATMKARVVPQR